MHQAVKLRHRPYFFTVNLFHKVVILRDAALHRLVALDRNPVFIPYIVHQIMVIIPPQILIHTDKFITRHLPQKTVIPVITVDVRKPVSIRSKLPVAIVLKFFQILGG